MQFIRNSIFTRSDTIFGVCEALGEDLGISPNWFRVGLASIVVLNFTAAFAAYGAMALLVLVSRILFPNRAKTQAHAPAATVETAAPVAEAPKVAPALAEAA